MKSSRRNREKLRTRLQSDSRQAERYAKSDRLDQWPRSRAAGRSVPAAGPDTGRHPGCHREERERRGKKAETNTRMTVGMKVTEGGSTASGIVR